MRDLLYDDFKELRQEILVEFPNAQLTGEYDEIHENRLSVDVECTEEDWYKWLLKSGFGSISLNFQLTVRMHPKKIEAILDEVEPGWRTR